MGANRGLGRGLQSLFLGRHGGIARSRCGKPGGPPARGQGPHGAGAGCPLVHRVPPCSASSVTAGRGFTELFGGAEPLLG